MRSLKMYNVLGHVERLDVTVPEPTSGDEEEVLDLGTLAIDIRKSDDDLTPSSE